MVHFVVCAHEVGGGRTEAGGHDRFYPPAVAIIVKEDNEAYIRYRLKTYIFSKHNSDKSVVTFERHVYIEFSISVKIIGADQCAS